MSVTINGTTYYRTAEVCRMVGISRTTLFRWLKDGLLREAQYRDRRGWRLFTKEEIGRLNEEFNEINRTAG
jgi:excisionase family DNA binding protein